MSQFEYIGVGISIVIALSVARLLEGLHDSFDPTRRYWIHSLWVVNKLMNSALLFWSGWVYRGVEVWTFIDFLLVVSGPGVLFLQVHTLLTAHPEKVSDWSSHFWEVRRWFFSANVLLVALSALNLYVVSETMFPSPEAIPLGIILLFSAAGIFSASERLHGVIAVVAFVNLGLGFGAIFLQAG